MQLDFRVIWAIDVNADTPEEAAVKARQMQLDNTSIATVFNVYSEGRHNQKPIIVDTNMETHNVN